jgi:hypothetical protein
MTAFYNRGPFGLAHYSAGSFINLAGGLPIVVDFAGANLTGDFVLKGDLPIVVTLPPAPAIIGPLWNPDPPCPPGWTPSAPCPPVWGQTAPCPDPGWTPSELCDG